MTSDFFRQMEAEIAADAYRKYDASSDQGNIGACTKQAGKPQVPWESVWADQKAGVIKRTFTTDYESSVPPEYTKDGKAHCYLYIAVQP